VDEKTLRFLLFVYSTHKKLHGGVGVDGNVYSTHGQATLTAVTDVIQSVWWFIIVYCFFTVSSVKFCTFMWFL